MGPDWLHSVLQTDLDDVPVPGLLGLQLVLLELLLSPGHQEDDLHSPAETAGLSPSPG